MLDLSCGLCADLFGLLPIPGRIWRFLCLVVRDKLPTRDRMRLFGGGVPIENWGETVEGLGSVGIGDIVAVWDSDEARGSWLVVRNKLFGDCNGDCGI